MVATTKKNTSVYSLIARIKLFFFLQTVVKSIIIIFFSILSQYLKYAFGIYYLKKIKIDWCVYIDGLCNVKKTVIFMTQNNKKKTCLISCSI